MFLPVEIVDLILEKIFDESIRYKCAVLLRRQYIRNITLLKWKGIDFVSEKGLIEVLNIWKNLKSELKWTHVSMDWASVNGHMDYASWNGHVDVLEWWKNSWKLSYPTFLVRACSQARCVC